MKIGVLFLYGGMEARQSAAQKEKALPSVCPTVQPKNNAVRLASIENREFFARMMSSSGCGLPDKRSRMRSSVIKSPPLFCRGGCPHPPAGWHGDGARADVGIGPYGLPPI